MALFMKQSEAGKLGIEAGTVELPHPSPYLVIDNTKRSTFVACPRKFYWSWVRNL